jgi:hypothetical protein
MATDDGHNRSALREFIEGLVSIFHYSGPNGATS